MNPVVHFEMPYDDPKRAARFYENAFGWKTEALGEKMNNYVLATTTATSAKGGPIKPGAINGGLYPKKVNEPHPYPSIVIAVDNLGDAIKKVGQAGGKVLGTPVDIPGIGAYVSLLDTEGNRVGMLQPLPR